eukprot:scaffold1954_cov153-Amphora_coffeaeformis.AAC.1
MGGKKWCDPFGSQGFFPNSDTDGHGKSYRHGQEGSKLHGVVVVIVVVALAACCCCCCCCRCRTTTTTTTTRGIQQASQG